MRRYGMGFGWLALALVLVWSVVVPILVVLALTGVWLVRHLRFRPAA